MNSLNIFSGDFLKKPSPGGGITSGIHKEAIYGKAQEIEKRSISIVWFDGSQDVLR